MDLKRFENMEMVEGRVSLKEMVKVKRRLKIEENEVHSSKKTLKGTKSKEKEDVKGMSQEWKKLWKNYL